MMRLNPILLALTLCACAAAPPRAPVKSDALYRSLGSSEGVARLVDATLGRVHADLRINIFFEDTDLADLRRLLIEQICSVSGGPCVYTGRSMEEAHSGMNLSEEDFAAFVEDLVAAMNEVGVDAAAQQQVLGVFGPMKPEIVGQ